MGPGQTGLELGLTQVPSAAVAIAVAAAMAAADFSAAEIALAVVLAFDIVGGVVANATTAGQRWYDRPGASPREAPFAPGGAPPSAFYGSHAIPSPSRSRS